MRLGRFSRPQRQVKENPDVRAALTLLDLMEQAETRQEFKDYCEAFNCLQVTPRPVMTYIVREEAPQAVFDKAIKLKIIRRKDV